MCFFYFQTKSPVEKKENLRQKTRRRIISWTILVKIWDMTLLEKYASIFKLKSWKSLLKNSLKKLSCSFPGEERREIGKPQKKRTNLMKTTNRSESLTSKFDFLIVAKKEIVAEKKNFKEIKNFTGKRQSPENGSHWKSNSTPPANRSEVSDDKKEEF